MAGKFRDTSSKSGGFTLEFQKESYLNFQKQMKKLEKKTVDSTFRAIVRFLFDIKTLAQLKLKSDKHIDTSRLRNSFFVKTLGQKYAKKAGNTGTYSAKGESYKSDLNVSMRENEGAVGTNVEYAGAIEFGYAPHTIVAKNGGFLSWIPGAAGQGLFDTKTGKTQLKTFYKEKSGNLTFDKQKRVFAKKVNHPGFAGDSFLHWALKNADFDKRGREIGKELLKDIK